MLSSFAALALLLIGVATCSGAPPAAIDSRISLEYVSGVNVTGDVFVKAKLNQSTSTKWHVYLNVDEGEEAGAGRRVVEATFVRPPRIDTEEETTVVSNETKEHRLPHSVTSQLTSEESQHAHSSLFLSILEPSTRLAKPELTTETTSVFRANIESTTPALLYWEDEYEMDDEGVFGNEENGIREGRENHVQDVRNTITSIPVNIYTSLPNLDHQYKLHTRQMRWDDAVQTCEEEGAYLAVPNSEHEAKVLGEAFTSLQATYSMNKIHIGISGKQDDFKTVCGEPIRKLGYAKWDTTWGYPRQNTNTTYLVMWSQGEYWNVQYGTNLPFFCEKEM